ncbi:MAG: FKBP-type peptidyl-prolyl cis-trans isomerase [Bacteroidetes bacterium]|nr:FKBP-type peptidyl-prolyl cis-trans isomerase [Bacteroidota bacterium]
MKKLVVVVLVCLFGTLPITAQKAKTKKTPAPQKTTAPQKAEAAVKTNAEKMSYAVGYDLALKIYADMKNKGLEFEIPSFLEGMQDAFLNKEVKLTPEEAQAAMMEYQQLLQTKQEEQRKKYTEMLEKVKKEGEDFLAENKKNDSVKVTASGLQYKILRTGSGPSPAETSTVVVDYRGRLINGTIFDESYARGEPATFKLNQVIRGWTEGLQLMNTGAKFEFYVPSDLAYGDRQAGSLIPAGSTLIFEVELKEIK